MSYKVRYWITQGGETKEFFKNQDHVPIEKALIRLKNEAGEEFDFKIKEVIEVTQEARQGITTQFDVELRPA